MNEHTSTFIAKVTELLGIIGPSVKERAVASGVRSADWVAMTSPAYWAAKMVGTDVIDEASDFLFGEAQPEAFDKGGKHAIINKIVWNFLKNAKAKALAKEDGFDNKYFQERIIKAVESYFEGQEYSGYFFGGPDELEDLYDTTFGKDPFYTEIFIAALYERVADYEFDQDAKARSSFRSDGTVGPLELTDETAKKVSNAILEKVKEGNLSSFFGSSNTITYVLENGYTIEQVSTKIANRVQAMISGVDDANNHVEIHVNVPKKSNNTVVSFAGFRIGKIDSPAVINFQLTNVTKNSELYFKIFDDPNSPPKEVRAGAIPFNTYNYGARTMGIKGISEDVTQWPMGPYKDNPEALQALREDNTLSNKDIRKYEFKFYKGKPVSITEWADNLIAWNNPATPQELVQSTIENRYAKFLLSMFLRGPGTPLEQSALKTFKEFFDDDFIKLIFKAVAIDKELARRHAVFNGIADKTANLGDTGTLSKQDVKEIEAAAIIAFTTTETPEVDTGLTEEDIEDRQKFYKQCALLMNVGDLSSKFESKIKSRQASSSPDGPIKEKPFGGRFWRATSNNKESLMTNLISSKDSSYMFEIPPHIMTQLTPKFRLYKVMNEPDGTLRQTEFIFPKFTDLNRDKNFKREQNTTHEDSIPSFLAAQFDKGDGIGLKSFSINFNGTNPAEARNDIKGEMSLYFQSFADFTRKRKSNNGKEYRFVDLIIQPPPDDNDKTQGVEVISLRQYEPTFYRIRVDMGYNIPKEEEIQGINSSDFTSLKNALKSMNKSYYLCMIDHEFNIKNDGTVEMKFTYRAYLETALKSLRFDALTTPELAKKRLENQRKLAEIAKKQTCTKEELKEMQLSIAGNENALLMNSLNSIMSRMTKRGKIFTADINNEHRKFFLKNGYFKSCEFQKNASLDEDGQVTGDLGVVLDGNFLSEEPSVVFKRDIEDTRIQFFFFGDLLHTILDALNDPETKNVAVGMENTKIILGSFDFDVYQNNSPSLELNISNIPISVDFFGEWFKDNVINQKSSRRTFPILNFIRNLSNYVISNALLETCVNRNIENSLLFQTGQISVISKDNEDPLSKMLNVKDKMIIDTDDERGSNLPLNGDVEGSPNVEDFYHYIVLNANGSSLTYAGKGKYEEDIESGRFHVEIGSNRGIVKTVKFSKTNMQYLREARFMRNGTDGLLQLSSVYKANVEMFGNTLFYPGMELWINPYGFGGLHLGRPQQGADEGGGNRSLANMLGLGGYHTITSVNTTLSPSGFTTSVDAQHYYSGDGEKPETVQPKTQNKKSEDSLIEMGVNESVATRDANFCEAELTKMLNFDPLNAPSVSGVSSIENATTNPSTSSSGFPMPTVVSRSEGDEWEGNHTVNGVQKTGTFYIQDGTKFFMWEEGDIIEEVIV
jgi:hypothetical protein